jgi:hypothetical protein
MESNELNKEPFEGTNVNKENTSDQSNLPSGNQTSKEETAHAASEDATDQSALETDDALAKPAEEMTEANKPDEYSSMDRESLINSLKQLLRDNPVGHIKEQVENIRKSFDNASAEIEEKARKAFVESGEPIELFVHQPDELQKQFSALLFEYRSKRDDERQSQDQIKEKTSRPNMK